MGACCRVLIFAEDLYLQRLLRMEFCRCLLSKLTHMHFSRT